jgi:hypothetical protein
MFGPNIVEDSLTRANKGDATVLKSNDLGIFVLHIHECRAWRNLKQFTRQIIRDVSEDFVGTGRRARYVCESYNCYDRL